MTFSFLSVIISQVTRKKAQVLTRSYANGSIIHETPVSRIMMRNGLCAGPFSLSKKPVNRLEVLTNQQHGTSDQ